MFRVYQGILSAQSPVFLDMFAMPQPEDPEMLEGVPVVDLTDDPGELTYFLRSLNDTCFYDDTMQDLQFIAAIVRLSTKYQVTRLRKRAIDPLLTAFPTTFEEFSNILQNPASSKIRHFNGMEATVVNIGEEVDVPQILPCAYYRLVNQPHQVPDGSIDSSIPEVLCPRASARCMNGREAVRRAMTQDIHGFIFRVCPYNNPSCNHGRLIAVKLIDDGLAARTLGPFHGPGGGNFGFNGAVNVSGLCATCRNYVTGVSEARQREAWESLPGWFGLPGWDKLLTYGD